MNIHFGLFDENTTVTLCRLHIILRGLEYIGEILLCQSTQPILFLAQVDLILG